MAILFGLLVPLLPIFGDRWLLLATVVLIFSGRFKKNHALKAALPFLSVPFFWLIAEVCFSYDLGWHQSLPVVTAFIRLLLLFLLIDYFSVKESLRTQFAKGLTIGLTLAAVYLTLQINNYLPYQVSYWRNQNRFAGSFSDPNALALVVFLSLPIIFSSAGKLFVLPFALIWSWIGLYSGSRTLLLGIGMLAVLVVVRKYGRNATFFALLPVGVDRFFESFSQAGIFNRTVFWQTAADLFLENPLVGVGYQQFRHFFPALTYERGLNLNLWSDNANSLYLGILVELGLIGFIGFLITIFSFRFVSDNRFAKYTVFIFLLLCFLGPHTDFTEVTILLAFLLSQSTEVVPKKISKAFLVALIPCTVLIFSKAYVRERGFYGWEQESGRYFRWTGKAANSFFECKEGNIEQLTLRALRPTSVEISSGEKFYQQIQIKDPTPVVAAIPCTNNERVTFTIAVKETWIPALTIGGEDRRELGVQLFSNKITRPF